MKKIKTKTPEVGQIWLDNDRYPDKRVKIIAVYDKYAVCETWLPSAPRVRKTTWIRLDRFRPTTRGYKYFRTTK